MTTFRSCVLAALLVMTSIVNTGAVEPVAPSPKEISGWSDRLRRAGATREELEKLETIVSRRTPDMAAAFIEYFQKMPPATFIRFLRGIIRGEEEPELSAIFPGAAPIMSCEALRGISIPDTTIDSAAVSSADELCRITATVV